MSGIPMYKATPYYKLDDLNNIELPKCMYKMKNVHKEREDGPQSVQRGGSSGSQALDALEQRQENILRELDALQAEVAAMMQHLPASVKQQGSATASGATCGQAQLEGPVRDIVINASPSSPPLSLFILYELLKQQFRCFGSVHVHSSVENVPEGLCKCLGNGIRSDLRNRTDFQLAITLIWKDVKPSPQMMMSAAYQTPIHGESNVARYLGRILQPSYDAQDPVTATEIDTWVDMAGTQVLLGNNKERAASLRSLNSRLGKHDWLVGSGLTLADMVMWSALHQTGQAAGVPANVKRWMQACNDQPAFQSALKLTQS
ncbi:aminoacyl tRNA synthase complex-interacting multifunctional protein 2-like [Branchiostoma lanceolatum]|uniref:aminoacyl tRNA synthase complex-interacting multifunctional protein 2-like n=1 Tax=Branchiostoma lanceolatum TaxID=7740 RepID=UPI003456D14A